MLEETEVGIKKLTDSDSYKCHLIQKREWRQIHSRSAAYTGNWRRRREGGGGGGCGMHAYLED